MEDTKFVFNVLALRDEFELLFGAEQVLFWRTDGQYAPITFFITCNDLFYWGGSDAEKITKENFPEIRRAIEDVRFALGFPKNPSRKEEGDIYLKNKIEEFWDAELLGALLFCARARKMRPQKPYYKNLPVKIHHLFDECGPNRTGHEKCCGDNII